MILDAYYRLRYYSVLLWCQGSYKNIATPETVMCDGTAMSMLYYGYSQHEFPGHRAVYALPYGGMLSQDKSLTSATLLRSNIIVGTGTTPPTAADYRMESELVSELTYQSSEYRMYDDGRLVYFKTMTNNTSGTLTITEVGLSEIWCKSADPSVLSPQVLVMREVLEEPIVVAPGETFTVSITHKFQIP